MRPSSVKWIALGVLALLALPARAESEDLSRARAYFEAGVAAYDNGRYEEALRGFQHAHALSHNPVLYFNMAACEEHLTHYSAAALLLRQYIIEDPNAEDHDKVVLRIKDLESRDDQVHAPAPASAPAVATTKPTVAPPPPTSAATPLPTTASATTAPSMVDARHRYTGAWIALGATAALTVAAAGTGGYVVAHHNSLKSGCGATAAGCTSGQISGLHGAAVATDVMIGLAAAAAVTTVVLFILEHRHHHPVATEQAAITPAGVAF